jgi:putative transcriptional regulator
MKAARRGRPLFSDLTPGTGLSRLAPGFLVASPALRDPNCRRTVVLLVEHGPGGSLGFVVNRPSSLSFDRVVSSLGLESTATPNATPELPSAPFVPFPLYVGGPVSPQSGWILFDPRKASEADLTDAVLLADDVALSASRALLETMARSTSFPGSRLLAMGYAGWAGGQLDEELERGVWLPATLSHQALFDVEPQERWASVLRREGIEPGRVVSPIQNNADPKNVC